MAAWEAAEEKAREAQKAAEEAVRNDPNHGGGAGVPKPPAAGGGGGGGGSGGIVGWYMGLLSAYPLATKTLTTGMLNLLGDAFAQTAIEKTESYDYKRSAIFFLLGVGFVGPALSLWYGALNKIITAQSAAGAMGRLALDQFVWAPVFIASFFAALLTCEGRPHEIQDKLRTDLKDAVLVNWKIWIPAQFINFRYTPPNLQVLFANGVALVWNTYLAWATHK